MKNEELDRLFKQKSELFRAEPSTQAWQQLEAQLQQRRRGKIWFYISGIAASLFLFAGIWFGITYTDHPQDLQLVSTEKEKATIEVSEIALNEAGITAQPIVEDKEEKPLPLKPKSSGNSKKKEATTSDQASQKANNKEEISPNEEAINPHEALPEFDGRAAEVLMVASLPTEAIEAGIEAPDLGERIIIRYTAQDETGPNLARETEEILASSKEEKELSVKSVIGFLKNVKENSSGSLADIREAKDNLLSLRFGQQN